MKSSGSEIQTFSFGQDLVFDAYIMFQEYIGFVKAMNSLKQEHDNVRIYNRLSVHLFNNNRSGGITEPISKFKIHPWLNNNITIIYNSRMLMLS